MAHQLRSIFLGLMITLWFPVNAHAVEVSGLYHAELPVSSQQADERKRVSTKGLDLVIRRISGDVGALREPKIQQALQSPESYVEQYSYYLSENPDTKEQQYIRLTFDKTLVNRLLRQAKQPIWGSNRPSVMMWVVVDDSSNRHLISADESTIWQRSVAQASKDVSVPILLPLMDLQDERNISTQDVSALLRGKLESASQRYHPEAVLGGRIDKSSSRRWAASWVLIFEGETTSFKTQGDEIRGLARDALAKVAGILVKSYAIDTTVQGNEHIKLAVQDIVTLQDYARVISYFKRFSMVHNVAVSQVEGDRLTLILTIEGGANKLKKLIALGGHLQPESDSPSETDDNLQPKPEILLEDDSMQPESDLPLESDDSMQLESNLSPAFDDNIPVMTYRWRP